MVCPTRFRRAVHHGQADHQAFHGYPWLIHRLTYRRNGHDNLHVRGYKEEGTTTTPFDMAVLNQLDRFTLVNDVINRVPHLATRAAYAKQAIRDKLLEHRQYIEEHGDDMPETRDWQWGGSAAARSRGRDTSADTHDTPTRIASAARTRPSRCSARPILERSMPNLSFVPSSRWPSSAPCFRGAGVGLDLHDGCGSVRSATRRCSCAHLTTRAVLGGIVFCSHRRALRNVRLTQKAFKRRAFTIMTPQGPAHIAVDRTASGRCSMLARELPLFCSRYTRPRVGKLVDGASCSGVRHPDPILGPRRELLPLPTPVPAACPPSAVRDGAAGRSRRGRRTHRGPEPGDRPAHAE